MAQPGPLSGITIIDLSRILAGPYCTLLLAELGARVIKVEPPQQGDDARQYGPFKNGKSAYFVSVNRGKESIALDLKSPAGREIFERLLDKADALVENFRPGTMEKLGYGWESLHQRYPRLVYAAASGFGHTGPYSHYPAYDMVVQGLGGIMSITGHPGMPLTRVGTSVGDLAGGLYTAVALNAALLHRERSGEATKVDVALFDCQLALLENAIMRYTTTGEIPGPMGARHPSITPFEAFSTRDGHIIIAAGNDGLFVKLAHALERADLAENPLSRPTRCATSTRRPCGPRSRACCAARIPATGSPCSRQPGCLAVRSTTSPKRSPILRPRPATCWSRLMTRSPARSNSPATR
jgi:CoA:oxalate CoA-transferase